jgi:beta-glucanase (GH16 family)
MARLPRSLFVVALLVVLTVPVGSSRWPAKSQQTMPAAPPGYTLVWSDEFNSADRSTPDPAKWHYDLGGNGWGNDELEFYTDHPQNAHIENGHLVITAQEEKSITPKGITREYTSARIKTQTLFSQAYGRFEARIQIPQGMGLWPAFWMLGEDLPAVNWPRCGEIDIMENIGKEPSSIHASLHGPPAPASGKRTADLTEKFSLPGQRKIADDFHLFAVEWEPQELRFYIDQTRYATFTRKQWPAHAPWPFDHKFFIILNLAVGGSWPGAPDSSTVFPRQMLVDYVRVYRRM